jgi:hypothetical protein
MIPRVPETVEMDFYPIGVPTRRGGDSSFIDRFAEGAHTGSLHYMGRTSQLIRCYLIPELCLRRL